MCPPVINTQNTIRSVGLCHLSRSHIIQRQLLPPSSRGPSDKCPLLLSTTWWCYVHFLHERDHSSFSWFASGPLTPPSFWWQCMECKGEVNMEREYILETQWWHPGELKRGHGGKMYIHAIKCQTVHWIWPENNLSFTCSCILWGRLAFGVIINEAQ